MDFKIIFDRTLGHEAGYVNNPNDPGGETKWGISKRNYPNLIIKELTEEDAYNIYLRDFWNPITAYALPENLAYQLFDFAVNSSIETAIRYFQRALGVADDGHFGPVSKDALDALTSISENNLVIRLIAERLDFMTRLSNWPNAGKGWARRIAQNLRYAALDS